MKAHLVSVLLFAPILANSSTLQLSGNARIEVVESISTRQLWNSTRPNTVESADVIVSSRMFDPEARPIDGRWHGCGIVMIGTGDLGIQPVTIRIWTMNACDLTVSATKSSLPQLEANFTVRLNPKEALIVHVTQDLKVSIDGKPIGSIED